MNDEKNKGAVFFPYVMPRERPDLPLSRAMDRLFANYSEPSTWWNELYSQFRYTELEGLDYRGGDGRLTRRDPSKVIKADGKYYVWYTRRSTDAPPQGPGRGAESIPSTDWDLWIWSRAPRFCTPGSTTATSPSAVPTTFMLHVSERRKP